MENEHLRFEKERNMGEEGLSSCLESKPPKGFTAPPCSAHGRMGSVYGLEHPLNPRQSSDSSTQ